MVRIFPFLLLFATCMGLGAATAVPATLSASASTTHAALRDGDGEARLQRIYTLAAQGERRRALEQAQDLVRDYPHFQLAQWVYAELLAASIRPEQGASARPHTQATTTDLDNEARLRLKALRERPPPGTIPAQFLHLPSSTRHAIAIDASRARLYLLENTGKGLRVVADYYTSVGKLGVEKHAEGDMRTPLGVYFINGSIDAKQLRDFYGNGALTLNYPNPYDQRRGKTGSGIWLHGTPPDQFVRAPQATDGCIVLANADLTRLLRTVQIRSTPVVIARQLAWVSPQSLQADSQNFAQHLQAWQQAKSQGDMGKLMSFYAADFTSYGIDLNQWRSTLQREVRQLNGRSLQLKELSYLHWHSDASEDTMVVTFGEVAQGTRSGPIKRQYWLRQGGQWKIFFEGVIG